MCFVNIIINIKYVIFMGDVMDKKLIIKKKELRGDDGYKVFSIRIKDETSKKLDALSQKTNRSRNELINIMLDWAMENIEIK